MTNNALLVVDVQKGFINKITKDLPRRIEKLQHSYETVLALQFINLEGSMFRRELNWKKLSLNTDEIEFAFKIRPDAVIFSKYSYGATHEFIEYLKENNISSIDLCGMDTDGCVTKVSMDLFDNGILPKVLGNYCASSVSQLVHEQALISLKNIIGPNNVL